MGLVRRKKSGNKIFDGSKLNVPGQGIQTKKIIPSDKIPFKNNNTTTTSNTTNNN